MVTTTITCAECGVQFCLPAHLGTKLREEGRTFYCPNGHSLSYKQSTVDKLREEIKTLERKVAWRDETIERQRREIDALEGAVAAYRMNLGKARKKADRLLDERNQIMDERNELVVQAKGWGPS
jgi:uncharacterized coiled-coil protein SlyX